MELFKVVKGTAVNRGRARTWVEDAKLSDWGFARGVRIHVEFTATAITVTVDPEGSRIVAGRPDKAVLDLCEPLGDRDARWGGDAKVNVWIEHGRIEIRRIA